jgi:hypothetical protein
MSAELEQVRSGKTSTAMPFPYWRFLRLRQWVRAMGPFSLRHKFGTVPPTKLTRTGSPTRSLLQCLAEIRL